MWLFNHPVKQVDVLGCVSSMHPKHLNPADDWFAFMLDDGSGFIECKHFWPDDVSHDVRRQELRRYRLGADLHVLGKISYYRGNRQVLVESCWAETDPHAQCLHWLRCSELWRLCYSRSFRVPGHVHAAMSAGESSATALPAPTTVTPAFMQHVLEAVERHAASDHNAGISATAIATALPAAVKSTVAGGTSATAVRYAVENALRELDDASKIFSDGHQRGYRREELWRPVT